MTLADIRDMPTCIGNSHESVMRSFHVVGKVKELCELKVPHASILEIISDLESAAEPRDSAG